MDRDEINETIKLLWCKLRTSDKVNYFCDIRRFIETIVDVQLAPRNVANRQRYGSLSEKISALDIRDRNRDNITYIRKAGNAAAHSNREINDAIESENAENIRLFNQYSKIGIFELLIPVLNEFGYETGICTYNRNENTITDVHRMPFLISNGAIYEYEETFLPNVYKCKSERTSEPGIPPSTINAYISETYSNRYETVCNLVGAYASEDLKNKIILFNSNQEIKENERLNNVDSDDGLKFISIISPLPTTLETYFINNRNTISEIDKLKIVRDLLLICNEMGSLNGGKIQIAHRYINLRTVFVDNNRNVKLGLFNWAKVDIQDQSIRTTMHHTRTQYLLVGNVDFNSRQYNEYIHPLMIENINNANATHSFTIQASKSIDLYSILMIFCYLNNIERNNFANAATIIWNARPRWYKNGSYSISVDFFKKLSLKLRYIEDKKHWVEPFSYQDIIDLFNNEIRRLERE